MGAMPGMSDDEDKPKGKGVDLAIIMGGKPKGGGDSMPKPKDESSGDELPPGFEEAATEAFPDMDPERLKAFWRAVKACDADAY